MPDKLPGIEVTRANITQEIRFAVVMYGGSSLAIYINGVTQELFHLVRATAARPQQETNPPETDPQGETRLYLPDASAPSEHNRSLGGTEAVYRRLAQLLGTKYTSFEKLDQSAEADAVRTRFVVDIISGTSAGGINGVFLAKALANDQDMSFLRDMWLDGGAIETLLNDAKTRKDTKDDRLKPPPGAPEAPQSLIDSRRMYCLIYDALNKMEQSSPAMAGSQSPYVDDLDLFVTRTDIHGLPISIRLSDNTIITDLQHRDVVHFQYAQWLREKQQGKFAFQGSALQERNAEARKGLSSEEMAGNDFTGANDPFLAYAARCTSAFPFAFEPMRLNDIQPLAGYGTNNARFDTDVARWLRFFAEPESVGSDSVAADQTQNRRARMDQARKRPFTDGGVLDNKPFSYAIDTLRKRWSDTSAQRKLVYIEPSPEILSADASDLEKPGPLEMVSQALIALPSYEAIHADLQRVLARNQIVDRVNLIIREVEGDLKLLKQADGDSQFAAFSQAAQAKTPGGMWSGGWLDADGKYKSYETILQERGVAYGAYHHLKIESVTDDVTRYLACQLGLKAGSESVRKLREKLTEWRQQHYTSDISQLPQSEIKTVDTESVETKTAETKTQMEMEPEFLRSFDLDYRMRRLLFLRTKINLGIQGEENLGGPGRLQRAKARLGDIFDQLRGAEYDLSTLRPDFAQSPLRRYLLKESDWEHRDKPDEARFWGSIQARQAEEAAALNDLQARLQAVKADIAGVTNFKRAVQAGQETQSATGQIYAAIHGIEALVRYMDNFEVYDSILFPALSGTGIGETSHVDLMRISPRDATSLIDEHTSHRRKLAGTALGNFGALLRRPWRSNDIMWGRLDAAERLIRDLVPPQMPPQERDALIRDAQRAIVSEEMLQGDRQAITHWLTELIPHLPPEQRAPAELDRLVRVELEWKDVNGRPPSLTPIFDTLLQADNLLKYMKDESGYEVDRNLPPGPALEAASRSAAVVGKLLEGAAGNSPMKNPAFSIFSIGARIGQVFAGLVEVATPHSIPNLLVKHWLKLLYLFEVFLIAGGVIFGSQPVQNLGWLMLLLTGAVNMGINFLHNYMQDVTVWQKVKRGALIAAGLIVVTLTVIGALTLTLYLIPEGRRRVAAAFDRQAPPLASPTRR